MLAFSSASSSSTCASLQPAARPFVDAAEDVHRLRVEVVVVLDRQHRRRLRQAAQLARQAPLVEPGVRLAQLARACVGMRAGSFRAAATARGRTAHGPARAPAIHSSRAGAPAARAARRSGSGRACRWRRRRRHRPARCARRLRQSVAADRPWPACPARRRARLSAKPASRSAASGRPRWGPKKALRRVAARLIVQACHASGRGGAARSTPSGARP